jgi:hypothetical protein
MIVNIRGTSGSGKTTIVLKLLKSFAHSQIWVDANGNEKLVPVNEADSPKPDGKLWGYELPSLRLRIVGRYETPCGGCDGISTQQEVEDRVRLWHGKGYHVLFEGLLISHIYGRWAKLAQDVGRDNMMFAFLRTPLVTCLERVTARRSARGVTTPLNPTNTMQKHADSIRVYDKCRDNNLNAVREQADVFFHWFCDPAFWDKAKRPVEHGA